MSFYVPTPGGYPDGPPGCNENPECVPLIRGFQDPPVIAFFALLAGCSVVIMVAVCSHKLKLSGWLGSHALEGGSMAIDESNSSYAPPKYRDEGLERALLVGQAGGTQGATPRKGVSHPERPHRDSVAEPGEGSIQFEGYKRSLLGSVGHLAVHLISLGLVFLYFVLIVDYYGGCQLRGPDAACFYGSYTIFGSYDTNSYVFLGLWCSSLCWVLALFAGCFRRNLFRSPCPLYEAQWVQATINDQAVFESDFATSRRLTIPALCTSDKVRSRQLTVPVMCTSDGVRFVVVESTRYTLDPKSGRPRRALLRIGLDAQELLSHSRVGLGHEERTRRLALLGQNTIPCEVDTLWCAFYDYPPSALLVLAIRLASFVEVATD